jgi:O-antigen/teichoic acid export membrane protein
MSGAFRQLIRDISIYGLSDALLKGLIVVTMPIYTRIFVPADYGVLNIVKSATGVVGILSGLGVNSAVQRSYFDLDEKGHRVKVISTGFWILLTWGLGLSLIGSGLAKPLSQWILGTNKYTVLMILALLAIPLVQLIYYCQDALRLHFAPWKYTQLTVFSQLSQFSIALVFVAVLGWGLVGFFGGGIVGAIIPLLFGIFLIRSELRLVLSRSMSKELVNFGYPLMLSGLAYPAFVFVDRLILKHFVGLEAVGLFSVALYLAQIMSIMSAGFGRAWSPFVYKTYNSNPDYGNLFARVFVYLLIGFSFAALLITVFAREVLVILTPPAYHPAVVAVGPLCIYMVANASVQVTAFGVSITRKTKYLARLTWISVAINILLDLLFVPWLGILGAGIALAVTESSFTAALCIIGQRLQPLPYNYRRIAIIIVTLIGFIAIAYLITVENLIFSLSLKTCLALLYPLLLYKLNVIESWEVKQAIGFIRDFIDKRA